MQLDYDSKTAQLFRYTYNVGMPVDIEVYIFLLFLAIILFPFTWISYPMPADTFISRLGWSVWGYFMLIWTTIIIIKILPYSWIPVIATITLIALTLVISIIVGACTFFSTDEWRNEDKKKDYIHIEWCD